jgi:serine/threonine-protein kinase
MSTEPETAAPADDGMPREGDILAGKYRIESVLGQGGMGVVVAAHHTTLRQKVAVKFLLPDAAKRDDSTERFLREARAAVSIQSEHIARVMDVGTLDTGAPYMVMEFLTGSDLNHVLASRGPLPIQDAVDYILQACEAIAEAHSLGIIHRDLKPANLFLTSRADGSPLIKVLDFGLSKVTKPDALDASLTAANVVMGSPFYMSPEQIRSLKGLDARTDVWALGVILYQLLTGRRPFEAESLGALFFTIGADPPAPPREHRADLPEELQNAILKCLEKDQKQRVQSVAQLARLIAPFGGEDARLSVERIHRVLGDESLVPRRSPLSSQVESIPPPASNEGAMETAATSGEVPLATADIRTVAISQPPPPLSEPALPPSSPLANDKAKSGSMAAVAKDEPVRSIPPPPAATAAKSRGKFVGGAIAAALVAVAAVTLIALRTPVTMGPQAAPNPAPAEPAQMQSTAALTAVQTATAHPETTAAPTATAAPSATATAAVSASASADPASAAPSASSSAKAGKAPKTPGAKAPAVKKTADPMDRWR